MATPTKDLGFQNFFQATLTSDITASSTDIPLDNIPNASQGFLVIEPNSSSAREVIFYTSKTALKVVCGSAADGRGQDDTTAGAHSQGATVIIAPIAAYYEAFQSGAALADNAIAARALAANAITLGYTAITANHNTGGIVTNQAVTGLTASVTIPAGSRRVKITVFAGNMTVGGGAIVTVSIWDGTVGSGTLLGHATHKHSDATFTHAYNPIAVVSPAAGAKTYNVGITCTGATAQINASATAPAFILVEAI